ncbi:unnamed protein product [Arabidopsis lyrata]|uniref:flocculation protein FLO11 isoform X1 n=1 Tax=Arabidopsis lyrata subsp. lyrata TaxID=81972 RepID=UPI000A29E5F3|nr:flocculation protein FLO11 isoform X1 [Arabidopsis lyrata subsp. lyrata]XP_020891083.1 flocculation protein FLO11 isoform X1 [Arabidopsis lyrata subsp. lyrata]XP_020891084.1 flocculation protein FLO11 isoform X1 [Arabidopsis lyrata subsp. lyrata]CAH8255963.1 unnamed protein product [Arabidopsis lyrata]|eukprot:XP_020891082.1 flocculation protein FLO11 isoform X1 [Arabidopsis lyrata subsp. lyrata]
MKIEFSEPECSNCYQCSNPGILDTQESEPRDRIGSSITSVPVSSGLVQACGHDSATTVSTSTSSPVQSSSPFSFGSTPAAITSVSWGPVQALGHDSAATVSTSTSSPVQALGHDSAATVSTSTSSPVQSSSPFSFGSTPDAITSVSSGPALSPIFGDLLATSGSDASATSTSSTSSPLHSSSLFSFGSAPAAITSVSSGPAQSPASTPKFGFSTFAAPTPPTSGTMHAHNSGSLFGNNAFAIPDVGSSPVASSSTTTEVFGATPAIFPSPFGPKQAPVQASASSTFTSPLFGCAPASPTTGTWLFNSVFRSTPASSSSDLFGQNSSTTGVGSLPGSPLNSCIPGFGVGYLPGSSSNLFRSNPPNFGGGSVGAGPQRFGLNGATVFPRSPFSSTPAFSNNLNSGSYPFASHEWSRPTEQGSRNPGYAPTHDGENTSGWSFPTEKGKGEIYISISASKPYLHKSHEELRWEDYKQGVKGGSFPAASASPIGSRPNFAFPPLNVSPSTFAPPPTVSPSIFTPTTGVDFRAFPGGTTPSSSIFDQRNAPSTVFRSQFPSSISPSSTTVPPFNSSVQRPHETATISPPAHGCTACGATSSSSASGHFTFNGTTTPPSAATTPPGLFFPTSGFGPMMFGTTLAVQGTTPALQAYPIQGYILLPFAAMSLQ